MQWPKKFWRNFRRIHEFPAKTKTWRNDHLWCQWYCLNNSIEAFLLDDFESPASWKLHRLRWRSSKFAKQYQAAPPCQRVKNRVVFMLCCGETNKCALTWWISEFDYIQFLVSTLQSSVGATRVPGHPKGPQWWLKFASGHIQSK